MKNFSGFNPTLKINQLTDIEGDRHLLAEFQPKPLHKGVDRILK